MAGIPEGRMVKPEEAYQVYQTLDGETTYYVLRHYKRPENEKKDMFARVYCMRVNSVCPHGEFGDGYLRDIKHDSILLEKNPLVTKKEEIHAANQTTAD